MPNKKKKDYKPKWQYAITTAYLPIGIQTQLIGVIRRKIFEEKKRREREKNIYTGAVKECNVLSNSYRYSLNVKGKYSTIPPLTTKQWKMQPSTRLNKNVI